MTRTQLLHGEFWVRALGTRVTRFSERSELALLNCAEGDWVDVSAEMESLLREALRAYELVRPGRARLELGCGLDLGGIAKGWMADRLAPRLGSNALANVGGDLRAIGAGPNGDGWPVGFAGVTVMLRDQGAATSSVRRRRWGDLHHLIDPRTGLPSQSGLEEVSVVAATGCDAEVVAKTALLLGPGLATAFCAAHAQAWWLG